MRGLFKLLLLLLLLWIGGFAAYFSMIYPMPADSGTPCEALVVLTGSAGRVDMGFELLDKGRAPRLFISGVGDERDAQAFFESYKLPQALRSKLQQEGVLTIDREASSTFENAYETKRWLKNKPYKNLCLITAHYHMPRSLTLFRHVMPDKEWIPISASGWDVRPEELLRRTDLALVLLREYHKWLFVSAMRWASQ